MLFGWEKKPPASSAGCVFPISREVIQFRSMEMSHVSKQPTANITFRTTKLKSGRQRSLVEILGEGVTTRAADLNWPEEYSIP